ncbi:MAG: hypothetical protein IT581_08015 [Verrucomicrobiales bacterium]|nr:hypothetical protein [Verrucomicrobiales bacterium]
MIQLLTLLWFFQSTGPAQSSLVASAPNAQIQAPTDPALGFTLKFTLACQPFEAEQTVLEIDRVLRVRLRQHDPKDRRRQNYPAFPMPDGSVPVLEATLFLQSTEHPDWKEMTIGTPLARLEHPWGDHDVVLNFTGVRWTLYIDGELLDNDFPFGQPPWAASNPWHLNPAYASQASIFLPALVPQSKASDHARVAPVQYWTPPGHNAWVGDVATFFHQGRYHVFYLYDRRHHGSKFGQGAHYFEHLSTTDFRQWTEHEAATPLEEPWECIGTGTPFVSDGKLCIGYGLHTERIYPDERTTLPAQLEHLRTHGRTGSFGRNTPGAPIGSTYSVSEDGVARFRKTWTVFHPCRNPSVYRDPSGRLRMLANHHSKGMWESDSIDGGWRCLSPDFPPGGDCTFFFRWGRFDYIIGGFKNLWSKPADAPDSEYQDVTRRGLDFYDGLNVPAVTEISGGRFLMAGWTTIRGWGGHLVIRELLQFPDGQIGSKWMPELTPETVDPKVLTASVTNTATFPVTDPSFLLSFEVQNSGAGETDGRVAVAFLPAEGNQASGELQIQLPDRRAQFGPASIEGFGGRQKSIREGGEPQSGGDYAVEQLRGLNRPFTVRVLVHGDNKIGGTLIDAEIAGQRTLLSYRPDLTVRRLVVRTQGANIGPVRIAPLRSPPVSERVQ